MIGDTGVGKTCMMIKFKDGHFLSGTYISTVGIDYRVRQNAEGMSFSRKDRFRGIYFRRICQKCSLLRRIVKPFQDHFRSVDLERFQFVTSVF